MNSKLNDEDSSPDLRDDNNIDAIDTGTIDEDVDMASSEGGTSPLELGRNVNNYDDVAEIYDEADEEHNSNDLDELWHYSKKSLFDYDRSAKEDEEEEEEQRDLVDTDFSPIKYDLTRFRYEAMNAEERKEIITKLKEILSESKIQMIKSKFLHKNYINVNRNSSTLSNSLDTFNEALIFEDTRYQTTLENYAQTRDDVDERTESLSAGLINLEENYAKGETNVQEIQEQLLCRELAVARKIRPRKLDKQAWTGEVDRLLEIQRHRANDVAKVRLAYFTLHYRFLKLQSRLRLFDCLGPGFSMMDYEYLLKKKEVYGEKCDEQREYIKKISEKNLSCAAIIRHINEESDLYSEKVKDKSDVLSTLEAENNVEHCKFVELVKERGTIFKNIMKLREEIGLLDNPFLLNKMESDLRDIAKLRRRSEHMKTKIISDKKRISQLS